MTDEEFEATVEEALDTLPPRFIEALDNVGVVIEDEPSADQLADAANGTLAPQTGELLGLYDGVSATERGEWYGEFGADLPDLISIFKGPHERSFDTREEVLAEVRTTVVHEIGHYFGLSDEDLDRIGLG
jgi:predicted Zn-dependent protease with MMP-like domain